MHAHQQRLRHQQMPFTLGRAVTAGCVDCRGVFGCHTALVLRRLRRLCMREYGSSPTFVVTSATIANPSHHVQALLGERHTLLLAW